MTAILVGLLLVAGCGDHYVRPGLEGCGPITAFGWGTIAPCPAR